MTRFNSTERLGVNFVERIFLQDFNWIPRKILETDVGIDMIIEICNGGQPTGRLIGVQIKSGDSYFKEETENSIIFRIDEIHINYWINNSLPILIVIHKPSNNTTLWQIVNRDNITKKEKNWRIDIPKQNSLSVHFKDDFEKLSNAPKIVRQFQQLLLDKDTISLLNSRQKICLDIERWVNKSSGRTDIQILRIKEEINENDDIEQDEELISEFTLYGLRQIHFLNKIFPWADFEVDEVFYEAFEEYDEDESPGYKLVFIEDSFHGYKLPIIPYSTNDETVSYRLVMTLNEFGQTFLDFYSFLEGGKQLKLKI